MLLPRSRILRDPAVSVALGTTEAAVAHIDVAFSQLAVIAQQLVKAYGDLEAPFPVNNLPTHVQALDFSSHLMLSDSFQGTPMPTGGKHVGPFFLSSNEGATGFPH